MPLTVSYRTKEGTARKLSVPEIDGIDPNVMLAGVVKQAIADSGPVAYVRLVTDTGALAAAGEAAATANTEAGATGDGQNTEAGATGDGQNTEAGATGDGQNTDTEAAGTGGRRR